MTINWAIDISGYDGRRYVFPTGYVYDQAMDWQRARDQGGISLAIIKSSEGIGGTDGAFRMNWAKARGILPRMAYHFFRSNQNAILQAWNVLSLLENDFDKQSDRIVIDFETKDGCSGQQCLSALGSILYELEKWGGVPPLIYTYPSFWTQVGGEGAAWAKRYPLALAQWPLDKWIANTSIQLPPYLFSGQKLADLKQRVLSGNLKPMALKPWTSPAIWQFTARADTKAVPGHPAIKSACDYNAVFMPLPGQSELPEKPFQPPVEAGDDNHYRVDAAMLKLFTGPGDIYKQSPASPLRSGEIVSVLKIITNVGEQWAQIESPAGWVRALWLTRM